MIKKLKKLTHFRPQIRSRHPSHSVLRKELPLMGFKSVIRLGSTTELEDVQDKGGNRVELNSVEAIKNSASKLRMKECFVRDSVKTADWFTTNGETWIKKNGEDTIMNLPDLPYPIVAKHIFGSRGEGNYLLQSQEELEAWFKGKTLSNYIFEKFYNYNREYRLHINSDGCFYTCRKMLKKDTPEDKRWYRNDSNSVWIVKDNPDFHTPTNWNEIEKECVKALKSCGLDFGACDVRVQSAIDGDGKVRSKVDFIIVEINSAPSFGELTATKYLEEIPKMLIKKHRNK